MKSSEWFDKKLDVLEEDVEYLTYAANLDFIEEVVKILKDKGVKHINKHLAENLGCSPAYVTKILRGNPNLTIKKMVEISKILDSKLVVKLEQKDSYASRVSDIPVTNQYFIWDQVTSIQTKMPLKVKSEPEYQYAGDIQVGEAV